MYNLLKGKEESFWCFGWEFNRLKTAERIYEEGVFVLTNAQLQFVWVLLLNWLKNWLHNHSCWCDIGYWFREFSWSGCGNYGKIDFVLHSIGMSVNVRKGNHYTNQNYEYTEKMECVSCFFHKVMQVLYKKDAMNE
jgi:enoyl-[acyl-carrier protein] reductase I